MLRLREFGLFRVISSSSSTCTNNRSARALARLSVRGLSTASAPTTPASTSASTQTTQASENTQETKVATTPEDFFEELHADALKLTSTEEKLLDRQLRDLLPKNPELAEFVKDYTLNLSSQKIRTSTSATSDAQFPQLVRSVKEEPYTSQELFLRKEFINQYSSKLGSQVKDVYIPHLEISHPQGVSKMSVAKLLAAGAHLGHSKSLYRSSNQQFIYGEYKGIHIIDLEKTLSYLKRACKVVENVALKGGIVLFVGSSPYERVLEKAAARCGGYYISTKWTAGTLTNATEISSKWSRVEVNMGDEPTGRMLSPQEQRSIVKPDLIVVLNPVENRVLLAEAAQTRIPTIGIIDTDSESSLVTYPIPANDDSKRAVTLLCGVLSKSAQAGYQGRMREFSESQQAQAEQAVM